MKNKIFKNLKKINFFVFFFKSFRRFESFDEEDEKRDEVNSDFLKTKFLTTNTVPVEKINLRRSTARNIPNANKIQKEEINKNLQAKTIILLK